MTALGRHEEAADVARAVVEAVPNRSATVDGFFWVTSVQSAALLAYLGIETQAWFEAFHLSSPWEAASSEAALQQIRDYRLIAFNVRYHPGRTQNDAFHLAAVYYLDAVLRERAAPLPPYRAWYSADQVEPGRDALLEAMRARLKGVRAEFAPAGFIPIEDGHFDARWDLGFTSDGTARAETCLINCPSCASPVHCV